VNRYADVLGLATFNQSSPASVTVNGQTAYRRSEYWRSELSLGGSNALWQSVTVNVGTTTNTGTLFVPPTPESYAYDLDGNLTADGRWTYTWDAENRLTQMESLSGNPTGSKRKLTFEYDAISRRIGKKVYVWNGSAYPGSPNTTLKFLYDGWNLLAELDGSNVVARSYQWGTDLSGSLQGAGGVGGLLSVKPAGSAAQFVAYDGNGNVMALADGSSGVISANYEYGPFGELIGSSGTQAAAPIRFSSKYQDTETDLVYYGYRYYNATAGRWPSRDPLGEPGFETLRRKHASLSGDGPHLYHFVRNNSLHKRDYLGLAVNEVQVVRFCRRNCGPDYTQAVNDEMASFRRYLENGPSTDGMGPLFLLGWFKKVLGSLDYAAQANRAGATADPLVGFPSRDCQGTITLCGKCVGSDVPGNIMFGFATASVGIPELISALGADYAEATDGDGEGDVGKVGFVLSAALGIQVDEDHDVFPLGQELFESGSSDMCSILSKLPHHATSSCSPTSAVGTYTTTKPFTRIPYPRGL
jgi:RHS repeat-associated protein